MPKEKRINVRLSAELRAKVEKACGITGLDEPTLVRACLEAFAEHVEKEGGIWLPLAVVPKAKAPPTPMAVSGALAGTDAPNEKRGVKPPKTPSAQHKPASTRR